MSAVKCRYGQNVHEGQNDAEESRHQPEHVPVPYGREEAAYGSEAPQRLGAVGREEVLQVAHVAAQHVQAVADASGEALEEAILYACGLVQPEQRQLHHSE